MPPTNATSQGAVPAGRDYAFDQAARFSRSYKLIPQEIRNPAYKLIAENFSKAVTKVTHLGNLPVDVSALMFGIGECFGQARHIHRHAVENGSMTFEDVKYSAWEAWLGVYAARMNTDETESHRAWNLGSQLMMDLARTLQSPQAQAELPEENKGYFVEGIEAILAAMLSNSYVAFESMTADLWVAALDSNNAHAKRWLEKNPDRQIKLLEIIGSGTDLTNRLGSILKNTRKVSFISLNDIKENYKSAFGVGALEIFNRDNARLSRVEQIRHLYAHTSGVIDQAFVARCGGWPDAEKFIIGQEFPIDGHIVCSCVSSCIDAGFNLLRFVDDLPDYGK